MITDTALINKARRYATKENSDTARTVSNILAYQDPMNPTLSKAEHTYLTAYCMSCDMRDEEASKRRMNAYAYNCNH